jgi:hypothetical protein
MTTSADYLLKGMRNPYAPVMKIIYEEDTAMGKVKKAAAEAIEAGKKIDKILLPHAEYVELLGEFGGNRQSLREFHEKLGIKRIESL